MSLPVHAAVPALFAFCLAAGSVAAAEVVVGMAIFVAIYRSRQTVDVNKMDSLSG